MVSQPSERIAIAGALSPATVLNVEQFTDVVDMLKFGEAMGIALLGNMANETVDFKCYYCDSDGSNAVALKTATQRAASATLNDNKQIIINVKAEDIPAITSITTQNRRYIKFGLVTGGGTGGPAAMVALGLVPKFAPASDSNLSSVVEIKS